MEEVLCNISVYVLSNRSIDQYKSMSFLKRLEYEISSTTYMPKERSQFTKVSVHYRTYDIDIQSYNVADSKFYF